ncbi:MAG: hypothetical protein QNK03_06175 [Myxococcota bacterium]|nr:hypothetical protein [Myxococcota bacterium]
MCVLRATGAEFDPDAFLEGSRLQPRKVFRRGDPRLPNSQPDGPRHQTSGIHIDVSEAQWSDLPGQVADAERFLSANRDEVERLAGAPGVTDLVLDFPIELRIDGEGVAAQFDRFPASLVRLAGALGLALELSTYPRSDG